MQCTSLAVSFSIVAIVTDWYHLQNPWPRGCLDVRIFCAAESARYEIVDKNLAGIFDSMGNGDVGKVSVMFFADEKGA